ncbi:MAG: hypothetical protein QM733_22970 [Ilumatobacteraceae bacterium]
MSLALPRRGGSVTSPGPTLPGLRIAATASLAAGAVHAAAAGVHAEHADLARLFVAFAAAQLGAGLFALLRPNRIAGWLIAAVNAAAVAGWALTRVTGISWIDGLQTREDPQFADAVCAGLGMVAVAGALAAVLIGWQHGADDGDADTPAATGARTVLASAAPIVAIAALAVPAMFVGGTTTHSHDSAAAAHGHGTDATGTAVHDHSAATGPTTTFDESQPHTHDADGKLGGDPGDHRRREPAARPRHDGHHERHGAGH